MVRLISRQRGGLAALKLTKLFGIDDFPAAKDSGKVLIVIIYCYLIIIIVTLRLKHTILSLQNMFWMNNIHHQHPSSVSASVSRCYSVFIYSI